MYIENMHKRGRILQVEDSHLSQRIVSDLLYENGYDVETVTTGEEALKKINSALPPDLVLMDIELEGKMDGIDTAKEIMSSRDIPVIFLTANTSKKILDDIKAVKGYGFVVKGSDKYALLSAIEMALKLHESSTYAKMFEWIFQNSLNELYVFNPKTMNFLAVNRTARENLGYTMEELKTMTPLDLMPEYDMTSFRSLVDSLFSVDKNHLFFKTVHIRKDGSLYPVEITFELFDYNGEKLCLSIATDLTERRALEKELEEDEAILSAIMNSAKDAIIILDEDGKTAFLNPAVEKLFGYSKEELIGKDLHRIIVTDENAYNLFADAFKRFNLTGDGEKIGKTVEFKARHKSGKEIDIEVSLSSFKILDSWYVLGIIRNVEERKQHEKEIEQSHKRFIELAENAPIGIIRCDKNGNIIYVNQKTLEILGSPDIEETKRINLLTFPLLVNQGLSKELDECIRNNKSGIYEINYVSKWGKDVWLRVHIKPLEEDGEIVGAQIIVDDITEKKCLEKENRQKEERIRLMVEGIPSPAWLVSKDHRILAQNNAAKTIFGTKVGDYCWGIMHDMTPKIAKNGSDLLTAKCSFCRADEAFDRNEPINSEVEVDGSIWDTWWIPLGDDIYLHYAIDVTKYKKIEEELRYLSDTDVLTNAYNRRYFIRKLEEEIQRSKRYKSIFSIIMLDIDHFKKINDMYGHNLGDEVLKNLSNIIMNRIRKVDVFARWGGEEFVVLLPDTTVEDAAHLAEELRCRLSNMKISNIENVTASFGVTEYKEGDISDSIMSRVDNIMYEAKSAGRNRVCHD